MRLDITLEFSEKVFTKKCFDFISTNLCLTIDVFPDKIRILMMNRKSIGGTINFSDEIIKSIRLIESTESHGVKIFDLIMITYSYYKAQESITNLGVYI